MTAAPETPIRVYIATAADRTAAAALISPATARGRASLTLLRAELGLLWVAAAATSAPGELPEQLVGLLLATPQIAPESERLVGYIHELLVHPAYRRRGVAMHLLDAAERYFLHEHDFAQIELATSPDNQAALQLYRSRGYRISRVRITKRRGDHTPSIGPD